MYVTNYLSPACAFTTKKDEAVDDAKVRGERDDGRDERQPWKQRLPSLWSKEPL